MTRDKVNRFVGQEVGQVLPLGIFCFGIGFEIEAVPELSIASSKPRLPGEVARGANMPFSKHARRVPCRFELFGDDIAI